MSEIKNLAVVSVGIFVKALTQKMTVGMFKKGQTADRSIQYAAGVS